MRDPNCEFRFFQEDKGCCDNCGARLPKYRRNWCSDECAVEYALNHNWAWAKREVWRRDHGACQMCGVVCLAAYINERHYSDYPLQLPGEPFWEHTARLTAWRKQHKDDYGEVDHIVPCQDYNAGCQHHLTNLRLLCHGCHVRRTSTHRGVISARSHRKAG